MSNLLARIPLFSDLPENEPDSLLATLKVVELQPRQVLFREGEAGDHFYVVTEASWRSCAVREHPKK